MPAIIGTAENPTAREIALRAMRILLGESSEYGREACENALQTAIDEREESISATVTLATEHPASSETAQEPAPSAHPENPDDTPAAPCTTPPCVTCTTSCTAWGHSKT